MRTLTACAIALLIPVALEAQSGRASTGFEFRTLSADSGLGAKTVRQMAVPFGVVVPLSSRLQVDAGAWYAQAERTDDAGITSTLSGLTDVQARAVYELVPDALIFTLATSLPTGHATLEGGELGVAGIIASDLIPFPVSNFGSGFSLTSGLAFAMPVGTWALGLAGSYRVNGEYQPIADNSSMYKPGGEMRLRLGVDRLLGQGRMSAGFTYSTFSTDEFGGSGAYRSGARYIPQLSFSVPMGNSTLALYAWDVYRGSGEFLIDTVQAPKQNTLTVGAVLAIRTGRSVLRPSIEFRKGWEGSATATGMEDAGTLFLAGLRYQIPLGQRMTLIPSFRFDTGSVPGTTGTSIGLSGITAGITLSTEW